MELSEAFKRFRKYAKITQKQAALAANVSERNYQDYEYGKIVPSATVLIALADCFNVSLDYLVGRSDDPGKVPSHKDRTLSLSDYIRQNPVCQEQGIRMTFSEHLLQLRKARGLKQTELASHLGISWRAYQTYERGQCEPQLSTLIALANFYGIPLDELACRHFDGQM